VLFNVDSGANGRKSAHPALRLPKNPVWKLKKRARRSILSMSFVLPSSMKKEVQGSLE